MFNVKISPLVGEARKFTVTEEPEAGKEKEVPEGAVVSGMAGLILSIAVKVGDRVGQGDLLAMIEAMKMRRRILAPRSGIVKEIRAKEGDVVDPSDVLMIVT
jgi:biotin carboxyl carrier protein